MVSNDAKEVFIQGITRDGKTFRPSDWAERLAGVMSQFRPGGAQPGSHLSYSPWCIPTVVNGVKCVVVNRELRDLEPMAWDFVLHFARDNDRAMALYRSMGFEEEGRHRAYAMKDGRYVDSLSMARMHPNPPRLG
jgi:hypothetical protein